MNGHIRSEGGGVVALCVRWKGRLGPGRKVLDWRPRRGDGDPAEAFCIMAPSVCSRFWRVPCGRMLKPYGLKLHRFSAAQIHTGAEAPKPVSHQNISAKCLGFGVVGTQVAASPTDQPAGCMAWGTISVPPSLQSLLSRFISEDWLQPCCWPTPVTQQCS